MSRVSIVSAAAATIEVDLWGKVYETLPSTRKVLNKAAALEDDADQAEAGGDADKVVEVLARMLELRLRPVDHAEKASTLLLRKWKADELTIDQIQRFVVQLNEAEADPT